MLLSVKNPIVPHCLYGAGWMNNSAHPIMTMQVCFHYCTTEYLELVNAPHSDIHDFLKAGAR